MNKLNWLRCVCLQIVIMTSPLALFAAGLVPPKPSTSIQSESNQNNQRMTSAAQPSNSSTAVSVKHLDQLEGTDDSQSRFSITADLSRSRNLVDFKDGTNEESTDIFVVPGFATQLGQFSAKIQYTQNHTNNEDINNGFADTLLVYSYPPIDWKSTSTYEVFVNPGATLVAPTSKVSQKQTELITATIFNFNLGVKSAAQRKSLHSWSFLLGLTAGRNFHPFEEDINGAVLNKYSSNQSAIVSYSYIDWSLNLVFVNRSRWTYKDNVRQSFIINQRIDYDINKNLSLGVGHTNEGSALKADGQSSNINFVDEKTSTVFVNLGFKL